MATPLAPTVPVAQMAFNENDQIDQRLYAVMQTFHESLNVPSPALNALRQSLPPSLIDAKETTPKVDVASPTPDPLGTSPAPLIPDAAAFQDSPDEYTSPHAPYPHHSNGQNKFGHNFQRLQSGQSRSTPQRVYVSGKVVDCPKPALQPTSKEDKARKRTFGDIVDLTQAMSDDDDFERHRSKPRTDTSPDNQPLYLPKMAINETGTFDSSGGHVRRQDDPRCSPTSRDHVLKERIVEPMNKRRDARRCSSYDPKTIARDILICSGKHPTMAPLNYHLEILRDRFDYVNNDSDLSTFRWDIVDPVEKSSEKQNEQANLANIMNQNTDDEAGNDRAANVPSSESARNETSLKRRGRPKKHPSLELPISCRSKNGGPEIGVFNLPPKAQDTARATMKHQENISLIGQQMQSPQADVDLSNHENRSALINSFAFTPAATSKVPHTVGSSNPLSSPLPTPTRSSFARCLRCRTQHGVCDGQQPCSRCRKAGIGEKGCIIVEGETGNLPPLSKSVLPNKPMSSALLDSLSPSSPALSTPPSQKREVVHGRKGRPPGAKNKQPRADKGVPKGSKSTSPLIAKPMRPPLPVESTPRRSSGLRNAISPTDGIAVVVHSRSPSVAGSGPQFSSKVDVKIEDTVSTYKSYKCGWEQCPAELHNLETLRKHVRKHCKSLDKPFPCKWVQCGNTAYRAGVRKWLKYNDEAAWDRHVETKHIRAVAKAQGDQLSGDSDEESSDQSLEDELSL